MGLACVSLIMFLQDSTVRCVHPDSLHTSGLVDRWRAQRYIPQMDRALL